MELETEFDFKLITPFDYANKGESVAATFIKLAAPSSRNSRECAALKQAFYRALPPGDKDAEEVDSSDIEGKDVLVLLAMSIDVDLPDVMDVAKKLFTSGNNIALVDGEVKLTNNLIDKMSQDDLESMAGDYMVNFILASSLNRTKKPSSEGSLH